MRRKGTCPSIGPMTYQGRAMREAYEPGLVSVIVPTYNRASLLPDALESVWGQSYRPIELLVVDDGSTDATRQVVEAWIREHSDDDRFHARYLYQPNTGQAGARNLGIVESRGEYVQLLDSDDRFPPGRFETVIAAAAEVEGFEAAVTNFRVMDRHGRPGHEVAVSSLKNQHRLAEHLGGCLWLGGTVFHRDFLRRIGLLRAELRLGEDWELGLRVAIHNHPERCVVVRRPLAFYRWHTGSRVVNMPYDVRIIQRLVRVMREFELGCGFGPGLRDLAVRRLLQHFFDAGESYSRSLHVLFGLPCSLPMKVRLSLLSILSWLFGMRTTMSAWRRVLRLVRRRRGAGLIGRAGSPSPDAAPR